MSLKNQASKKASQLTKTVKASKDISVQLTDSSFTVIANATAKDNQLKAESRKAGEELANNLILVIEGAGLKIEDYEPTFSLDADTKQLTLTKKV